MAAPRSLRAKSSFSSTRTAATWRSEARATTPMRIRFVCFMLTASTPLACADDGDGPEETTTVASATATDSGGDSTSATSGTAESTTGAPLPDPGQQDDPCACEGEDPNACDATQSNCGDPLSCIAGFCRQECASVDDTSCPEGTACIGIEIDGVDLGFWCG